MHAHQIFPLLNPSLPCIIIHHPAGSSSIYIVLSIMIQLCSLTFEVFLAMTNQKTAKTHRLVTFGTTAFPIFLMCVAYLVENADPNVSNGRLNIARHAFSCSMRFPDMTTEWLLLWVCTLTLVEKMKLVTHTRAKIPTLFSPILSIFPCSAFANPGTGNPI
jgi:hypothetical protein